MYSATLFAQSASSEAYSVFENIPQDLLGALMILGAIFGFIVTVVLIRSVCSLIEKVTLARMSKSMVDDMLAKGYSPQEVRMVFEGEKAWDKLGKFFGMGKRVQHQVNGHPHPAPPVKHADI